MTWYGTLASSKSFAMFLLMSPIERINTFNPFLTADWAASLTPNSISTGMSKALAITCEVVPIAATLSIELKP